MFESYLGMVQRAHSVDERLSGWGCFPVAPCVTHTPRDKDELRPLVGAGPVIARGAGRAYGDSALQSNGVIHVHGLGRRMRLNTKSGVLEVDAAVNFINVLELSVPKGWFVPVTPGTRFVTFGGALASDVHGKNHHSAGSFGDHVLWFDLICADGQTRRCSAEENPDLFTATIGGMGLTGMITRLAVQMIPVESAWMRQETVLAPNLDAAFEAFEASQSWTYSVAWIDALARGKNFGRTVLFRGEHARRADLDDPRRAAPFDLAKKRQLGVPSGVPGGLLNRLSAKAFNIAYWSAQARKPGPALVDYQTYFYPLDGVLNWNRLYGRRGFVQYQCVLPLAHSRRGLAQLLEAIQASREGAFLAVLKLMGPNARAGAGLSFPMEGYTLALDFPVTKKLPRLLARLDAIVTAYQGRIYLAKDSRMSAETFRRGYGNLDEFETLRRETGAAGVFQSHQSERLGLL